MHSAKRLWQTALIIAKKRQTKKALWYLANRAARGAAIALVLAAVRDRLRPGVDGPWTFTFELTPESVSNE